MTTLNDIAAALLAVTGFMDDTSKDKITRQINPTLNISCTFIVASAEPAGVVFGKQARFLLTRASTLHAHQPFGLEPVEAVRGASTGSA